MTPEEIKGVKSKRRVATLKAKEPEHTDKGLKELINEAAQSEQFKIPSISMEKIKSQIENPKGLHQRYQIKKLVVKSYTNDFYGNTKRLEPKIEAVSPDKDAEYFVLRLDTGGSDINHIKACRIGIHAYADAIEATIPELARDLRERYPLL